MVAEPRYGVMPYWRRVWLFRLLVLFFVVILPIVILYTSGYRLVQTKDGEAVLTTTGGMYVAVFSEDVDLYIDNEVPNDRRPFSSAFYVQGFDPNVYTVHTQGEGVETWVKNIPVYPHIVTQAFTFNMPRTPVVRLITEWNDESGNTIVDSSVATTSTPLAFATTTNDVVRRSTQSTSTLLQNPEYVFFEELFASTSADRRVLEEIRQLKSQHIEDFAFSSDMPEIVIPTTSATSTVASSEIRLSVEAGEVYATWLGDERDIPHYFCVPYENEATTTELYGAHVYESLVTEFASSTGVLSDVLEGTTLCRSQIRIDRKWQQVEWFDFVPGSSDLVLMHLEDGLYVVEIDDRAWQNVQMLYPGDDIVALVDAGRVMVKDGDYFLEVFTEIPQ